MKQSWLLLVITILKYLVWAWFHKVKSEYYVATCLFCNWKEGVKLVLALQNLYEMVSSLETNLHSLIYADIKRCENNPHKKNETAGKVTQLPMCSAASTFKVVKQHED